MMSKKLYYFLIAFFLIAYIFYPSFQRKFLQEKQTPSSSFYSEESETLSPNYPKDYITTTDAANYIGQEKTVCGRVASTKYAYFANGEPTFLNFDRPYPNHTFTAVIWGKDRSKFSNPPESYYNGKFICVHGLISSYRGIPQIVVRDPSQITIPE